MKIKVSEAAGPVLDYMVAQCEGVDVRWSAAHEQLLQVGYHYAVWQPHKNWAQGGPIIEREMITITPAEHAGWQAFAWPKHSATWGDTPLEAAMRCYCFAKLGDEIDIPEELCQQQSS